MHTNKLTGKARMYIRSSSHALLMLMYNSQENMPFSLVKLNINLIKNDHVLAPYECLRTILINGICHSICGLVEREIMEKF